MKKRTSVDEYIDNADAWQTGLRRLRKILLACGLEDADWLCELFRVTEHELPPPKRKKNR